MLIDAFQALLDIWVVLAMVSGIAVGVIIGAIPGLGPSLAIALLIPVTFSMQPIPAMLLLLGVYQGAIFGGSISAILLNVPGTPSAAATAIDGYAQSRQGKAGRALRLALYASVSGNVFSCLVLLALAQPLAAVALDFGPAEMAVLMIFALLVIILFGGGSKLNALIMVLLGVCASTIGLDPISGAPRFHLRFFRNGKRAPIDTCPDRPVRDVRGFRAASGSARQQGQGNRNARTAPGSCQFTGYVADAGDAVSVLSDRHVCRDPARHRFNRSSLHEL